MATLTDDGKRAAILERGAVLTDPDELLTYESDGLTLFKALADFVVFAQSVEHVSAVVKLANREGLSLQEELPRRSVYVASAPVSARSSGSTPGSSIHRSPTSSTLRERFRTRTSSVSTAVALSGTGPMKVDV